MICPQGGFKEVTHREEDPENARGICLQDWVTEWLLDNSDFGMKTPSERALSDFLCMSCGLTIA